MLAPLVAALIFSAAPPQTRETLRTMYVNRDVYCGTRDPWANFVHFPKSPAEVALLKTWAMDPAESREARRPALEALAHQEDPALAPWWRELISRSEKGTPERSIAIDGLLTAGGDAVVDECYAHLGETEDLDLFLILAAVNRELKTAPALLRAYQRSNKASPKIQAELTQRLLELDPANAANDDDLLLAAGDDKSLWSVVHHPTRSVPTLKKLLLRLERPEDRLQADVADRIAFDLFKLLRDDDAEAVGLAQAWAAPPPATESLLARAPAISLVLALWHQSRGELNTAAALFQRALGRAPSTPADGKRYDMSTPQVAYAGLMLQHACMLEGTGQREAALTQLRAFEGWSKGLTHEVGNLLDNLAFKSWSPFWCYLGTSEQRWALMPLVLTGKRTPLKAGFQVTVEVHNASSKPVNVKGCPMAGGGFLPGDQLYLSLGETSLDAPRLDCRPTSRTLAAGDSLSATFVATPRKGAPLKGPLSVTLRPLLDPRLQDQDNLFFLFADGS